MKTNRFQFEYRKSASKLHRAVGDCLRDSEVFCNYKIYQEYPVNRINPDADSRWHYDWVIYQLKVVIECHGEQHYRPVAFGGDIEQAVSNFEDQKIRDNEKKQAALTTGWIFVEIPFNMIDISESSILELIELGRNQIDEYIKEDIAPKRNEIKDLYKEKQKKIRKEYLSSKEHKEKLRKAKEYRHEQYKRLKANR